MDSFFSRPIDQRADNPKVVTTDWEDVENIRAKKIAQVSGSERSGIVISRLPNRRASIENAPGPRQTSAPAIHVARAVASLVSNKLGEGV